MKDFNQWLESNGLSVMGGNVEPSKAKRKKCDCGILTSHSSGMCKNCRKAKEAQISAYEDMPHGVEPSDDPALGVDMES